MVEREYMSLKKASKMVIGVAAAIVILLFVGGMILSSAATEEAFSDEKFAVFFITFLPYAIYIMLIITAAKVISSVLDHLMRMEIIALEGAKRIATETFESDYPVFKDL